MDSSSFPTTAQVRQAHPGDLAVLLSSVTGDRLAGLSLEQAEAVVVATQRVASWAHAVQAMAVDRFAEQVLDAQEAHAADLTATREAQRASVEARDTTWRGESGAVAMPEPEQIAASMLAPELRISPRTMRTRLARARASMELPHTLGLALAGDLDPGGSTRWSSRRRTWPLIGWWSWSAGCTPLTSPNCPSRGRWSGSAGPRPRRIPRG